MTSQRTRRRKLRRAAQVSTLGAFTLFAVLLIASQNPVVFERLSSLVFDLYQQIRPRQEAGAPILVVDVDEASLKEAGQWPWPRSELAGIVDRLGELGAAVIAFDFVFAEPDRTSLRTAAANLEQAGARVVLPSDVPDNDEILAASFARSRVTAGFVLTNEYDYRSDLPPPKTGFAFAGRNPEAYLMSFAEGLANLPVLTEGASGLGFFSFPPSADNVVRIVPLVARGQGNLYPSLAIEALRVAQGAGSIVIRATGASGEADTGHPAMTALKVGDFEVPTGPAGDFRVYYSGLPNLSRISAARLLDDAGSADLGERVAGHIVLVGSSAVGLRDLVATPLAASVPGVNVHAEIIDQILGGMFLTRPDWAPGAEAVVATAFTILLLASLLVSGAVTGAVAGIGIIVASIAVSWVAFASYQFVLDPIVPSVAVLSVYVVATGLLLLLTDRERQFVRRAFGQYLSPALVQRLADDPAALSLGGETRELTVLFCDIRGFTSLSESLDPQDLTRLLNRFFTPMTNVLLEAGATIDKYVGDQIMAFWNAPLASEDHPRQAGLAVLRMLEALQEINRSEGVELKVGIGLNTGHCCVGNLGSEHRFSYSAVGDAVNVAARVEGLTKQYGLSALMTESTAAGAADLALIEVDLVRVVGRGRPVSVFTILGDRDFAAQPEFRELAGHHGEMIRAYRAGQFTAAEEALANARVLAPLLLDPLYALYDERLSALRKEAPASSWDGVYASLKK